MAYFEKGPVVPYPMQGHGWMARVVPKMYSRRGHALSLRKSRNSYGCSLEKKASISSRGVDWWYENFCGITRVALHGVDTICVVFRNQDLEHLIRQEEEAKQHMGYLRKAAILPTFGNAIMYEVEDLAAPSDESCKTFNKSIEKPFGVVSVIPGTEMGHKVSGHEASSAEYDADKAIKFLQEEMKSEAAFTFAKTVQTAIFALQHLFGKKFKADEIRVFVLKCGGVRVQEWQVGGREEEPQIRDTPYELLVRGERSIEDHLSVINKPLDVGSGGGGSR